MLVQARQTGILLIQNEEEEGAVIRPMKTG